MLLMGHYTRKRLKWFCDAKYVAETTDVVLVMQQYNLLDERAVGTMDQGDEAHLPYHLRVDIADGLHSIPVEVRQMNDELARWQW